MNFPLPISSKRSVLYAAFFNTKGQVVVIYLSKSKWAKGRALKGHLKATSSEWMCNADDSLKSKNENLDNVTFQTWTWGGKKSQVEHPQFLGSDMSLSGGVPHDPVNPLEGGTQAVTHSRSHPVTRCSSWNLPLEVHHSFSGPFPPGCLCWRWMLRSSMTIIL